jgi:hypothetical protein
MDFLAPSACCLLQVKHRLESGQSVTEAIRAAIGTGRDDFTCRLRRWWIARERGASVTIRDLFPLPLQRLLIETFERGLRGEPIHHRLSEVEEEMKLAMIDSVERHLQKLPVLMLLPLTGLIFPSFMLLLVGPLLKELLRSLG